MSQDFQSIGQASPELDAFAAEREGWPDDQPQSPIDQATDHTTTIRGSRSNYQVLGRAIPSMAGYDQTPTAGKTVSPYTTSED